MSMTPNSETKAIDDGGQAFPHGDETNGGMDGMSLRDYFAAQALAGWSETHHGLAYEVNSAGSKYGPSEMAIVAYRIADAMLKARQS